MSRKTIYFDCFGGLDLAAVVENNKIREVDMERRVGEILVGSFFKGKVRNLLNGMQAAFIDCGLERNCYISAECLFPDRTRYEGGEIDIPSRLNLHVGDEIIVQVLKPPVGTKGAKVTTCLSFVGKSIIYMPETPFVGISRKIDDMELRKNLTFMAERLRTGDEGIIVRTAAPYSNRSQITDELAFHRNVYADIRKKFRTAPVGTLLHSDMPLPVRVLRDTLSLDIDKIVVGNAALGERIQTILKLYPLRSRRPVVVHDSGGDLFYEQGLTAEIAMMRSPKVPIDGGAYLIIEHTEALTVIDVNTGKFVGGDSLEQTVYQTNIAAAREIARQVQLRNIGGIVVVDFIDMTDANHRRNLVEELNNALRDDKAKCRVLPMSELGLVQFTRKRIGKSILDILTKPCRYCNGSGYARSAESVLLELRAKALELLNDGHGTLFADINFEIANRLTSWKEFVDDIKNRYPRARIYIVSHRTYHEETFTLRYDDSPAVTVPDGAALLY